MGSGCGDNEKNLKDPWISINQKNYWDRKYIKMKLRGFIK